MKGQLGRDTGRLISNFLFGDKHSAPFRRVGNGSGSGKSSVKLSDKEIESIEYLISVEKEQKELSQLAQSTSDKIENVLQRLVPDTEGGLVKHMTEISALLYGHGWKNEFSEKEEIINKYSEVLLNRLKTGLFMLETTYPSCDKIPFFQSFIKKQKRKSFFKRNIGVIIALTFFALMITGLIIAEYTK